MRPAVTVVVTSGDDASKVELETALRPLFPEIPVVDLGGRTLTEATEDPAVANSDYLWFLTPDCRPEPGCLDELLDAIGETESIAAVGPKLMRGDRIVSAGVSTTPAGERFNPVGSGEIDQGQRDSRTETLGLDLPGLLMATAELTRIGAPSRVLGPAYRGIEYSRRLRDLGRRVLLAPGARMEISAEAAAQLRSSPQPPVSKFQIRTEQRYRLSLAGQGQAALLFLLAFSNFGHILGGLLSNNFRSAGWYLGALFGLPADARTTAPLRRANARRSRSAKRTSTSHVAALYADADELAVQRRSMGDVDDDSHPAEVPTGGPDADAELNPIGDTEEAIDSFSRLEISGGSSLLRAPLTYVVLAAVVMSGFISYRLFGPGHLDGGALGTTDVGLGEIFSRLLGRHLDVSTGAAAPADPYHLVLGTLSLLFFGHVDIMVRTLLLAAPILAGITAYAGAGSVLPRRWVRGFAALLWIASPLFTSALSDGRLGVVLVWICAPLLALSLRRSLRTGSIAAAAGSGLLLFVIISGIPLLLTVAVLGTAVLLVAGRGLRHLWLLAPTLFLAWPWLWALVREPGTQLTMPGQTIAAETAPTYLLAVGFPGPIDLSWLADLAEHFGLGGISPGALQLWAPVLVLPMLILAFFTLIEARLELTRLTWAVGLYLGGLILAAIQVHLPAQTGPFHLIGSYPAAGLTLISLGAILLLSLGADRTSASRTGSGRMPMRGLVGLVAVASIGLIAIGAGRAATSPEAVTATEDSTVPALAADRAEGDAKARTLRLDNVDGEVLATLLSAEDGTVLGTSTVTAAETVGGWPWQRRPLPIPDDQVLVAQAAAALSADDAGDVSDILGELGADFVLVGTNAEGLQKSVSVAQGLIAVGPTESGQLWRVDKPSSGRFLIRDADGRLSTAPMHGTTAEVPAGEDGRTLIIADAADGITARSNGEVLPQPENSQETWVSEFDLPASGGRVELSLNSPAYPVGVIAGWVLGALSIIAAIPFGGSRRHTRVSSRQSGAATGQTCRTSRTTERTGRTTGQTGRTTERTSRTTERTDGHGSKETSA
ncbi:MULTISPECIES: glycosyltransferase family 2 protein [unclassified Brevibacterium]|uniref:glycosyltransferase family 2 protein n=1 Tax=unclassified Brevibacterium TaxID=2614124 RepID=UPI0010821B23|nr:glycosyl transferase [Brevibacterium sp. S111]TGD12421.1 glycosyl transferase [Brevibacterium sp. S111]